MDVKCEREDSEPVAEGKQWFEVPVNHDPNSQLPTYIKQEGTDDADYTFENPANNLGNIKFETDFQQVDIKDEFPIRSVNSEDLQACSSYVELMTDNQIPSNYHTSIKSETNFERDDSENEMVKEHVEQSNYVYPQPGCSYSECNPVNQNHNATSKSAATGVGMTILQALRKTFETEKWTGGYDLFDESRLPVIKIYSNPDAIVNILPPERYAHPAHLPPLPDHASIFLSCIFKIYGARLTLPSLGPTEIYPEKKPEITRQNRLKVYYYAMGGLMCLVKRVDTNSEAQSLYIGKRWSAFRARALITDATYDALETRCFALHGFANFYKMVSQYPTLVYQLKLLVIKATNLTPATKAIHEQVIMVWKGYGLKSVEFMANVISSANSALRIAAVTEQAKKFLDAKKALVDKHGELFDYGYVLGLPGFYTIKTANFPDLYYAGIALALSTGVLQSGGNFIVSNHTTTVSKQIIKRMVCQRPEPSRKRRRSSSQSEDEPDNRRSRGRAGLFGRGGSFGRGRNF